MAKENKSQAKLKEKELLCPDCGVPLESFRGGYLRCPDCGYVKSKD